MLSGVKWRWEGRLEAPCVELLECVATTPRTEVVYPAVQSSETEANDGPH